MNEMMMAMLMGSKALDKTRFAQYLRDDRARKEKDYAKIARAFVFGAYYLTGSLKLQVTNSAGQTVPATDAGVSTTAKLDALLNGEAEIWRAIPYFGFLNEVATFVGEVIARSTTMDPALMELMSGANGVAAPAPTITVAAPPPRNYAQPQTVRIQSPSGQSTPLRFTANGIVIDNPEWSVTVD